MTKQTTFDINNKTAVFLRLIAYLKPYWWAFILVVIGFAMGASSEVASAKLFEYIIDAINQDDKTRKFWFPFLVILLFICRGLASFLGGYYSAFMARSLVYEIRTEVFKKLLKLPSHFYLYNPAGTISSKLIFDVEQVTAATTDSLTTLLKDGITTIALFGYLFYTNWRLTLVLLTVVPPIFWLIKTVSKKFARLSMGIQESMSAISHIANEAITGFDVVKNYGGQAYEQARFDKASKDNLTQGMKMSVFAAINTPMVQLLMAIGMCFVVWLSLRPEVFGNTTAGEFAAYLVAAGLLARPIKALTDVNQKLQRGIAAGASIFQLLDAVEENDKGGQIIDVQGDIRFEKVNLQYDNGVHALTDFNLHIKAGETVAIVGRSGSGKTTLVNLLTRTIEPSSGQVLIDNTPIEHINLADLRKQVTMVNQKITLFSDTVRKNIAYGLLGDKSFDEVKAAAKSAYAHDFIMDLPNGYDSFIGTDGLQLSGGQRQRLSIARALLKDAPILILDEATSALDNESEFFVQKALETIMKGRTTVVIAHRLSTIEKADEILVVDQGKIVERGSHSELMALDGAYKQLHKLQFGA